MLLPEPLLKCRPEDFQVEEILEPRLLPIGEGFFRVYQLKKTGWGTAEAVASIAKSSSMPKSEIRYAGRKDKNAVTVQHLSAPQNRRLVSGEESLELEEVGGLDAPLAPSAIRENRFKLTLRRVHPSLANTLYEALVRVGEFGFANYFDEQRFGSVGKSGAFLAERIIKKQFSGALKLYLCEERRRDAARDKQRRKDYSDGWGNWSQLRAMADSPHEQRIFDVLARRGEKEGMAAALSLIPREELEMYFAAWQSFLWNETLSLLVSRRGLASSDAPTAGGDLRFPHDAARAGALLSGIHIPTAASRLLPCSEEVLQCVTEVLQGHALRPPQMNTRKMRVVHLGSFLRGAWVIPSAVKVGQSAPDALHAAQLALTLEFTLPRGSYATMLIKAAVAASPPQSPHKAAPSF